MKYYLFIDESGDHSLTNINADFPIFALLGLIVDENNYSKMCTQINGLKIKYFHSKDIILHSRDIRKCEGVFSVLFDLNTKKSFYEDLNAILTSIDYTLVSSAILKQKHINQYGKLADDPYEISLTFVLERVLFESDSKKFNQKIDVIIESRGKKEDRILAQRYNELLYKGSGQVSPERFIHQFNQEILFKRKNENDVGLQIADLCAYPIARHVLLPNEPYPAFNIIEPKIRRSIKGIDGFGLKIFP